MIQILAHSLVSPHSQNQNKKNHDHCCPLIFAWMSLKSRLPERYLLFFGLWSGEKTGWGVELGKENMAQT